MEGVDGYNVDKEKALELFQSVAERGENEDVHEEHVTRALGNAWKIIVEETSGDENTDRDSGAKKRARWYSELGCHALYGLAKVVGSGLEGIERSVREAADMLEVIVRRGRGSCFVMAHYMLGDLLSDDAMATDANLSKAKQLYERGDEVLWEMLPINEND